MSLVQWLALGSIIGVMCGTASALFLWALEWATAFRLAHPALPFALPAAGLLVGLAYERLGQSVAAGHNLIIDTIHDDGPEIPLRMAPLVLVGTVLTHLFGGSAGREGTAVQMGASLTDWMSHRLALPRPLRRQLLAAGVAGGFGSVFGTPVAGALFGLEFVVLGRIEYGAVLPALAASIVGDMTTRTLGVVHTPYPAVDDVPLTGVLVLKWLLFAAAVAIVTVLFIELTHAVKRRALMLTTRLPVRMMLGGLVVAALWRLTGSDRYLGLGVPTIVGAFNDSQLPWYSFAAKALFTSVTIGTGFLGGEVTPLFFVGATFGNASASVLGIPLALATGVGLAAVFGAAANTPLALAVMAAELFGAPILPHAAIVCTVAYVLSGHRSIYSAQRVPHETSDTAAPATPLNRLHRQ